jgi:hypothetical protein
MDFHYPKVDHKCLVRFFFQNGGNWFVILQVIKFEVSIQEYKLKYSRQCKPSKLSRCQSS